VNILEEFLNKKKQSKKIYIRTNKKLGIKICLRRYSFNILSFILACLPSYRKVMGGIMVGGPSGIRKRLL
jgi:hypothetical protein